ncbi:response regulator transcription factor [Carnobacterium inhibens]|uniref:Response regulator n=1 Tax=Carnobacterium inhibens TaxID=147709 RepID=A0ABR7TFJ8_9LACT|nr:response regulator transcription factor [Carnobacterium inhibens]MBC9826178.1 response regulator [Carnobacterium inhibens]
MKKILIVDDERVICEVLEAYFVKEGWKVLIASNGLEGIKKAKNQNPDLIVLDLMLPDISGEEICRLVRKDSNIPILMLTAKSAEEDLLNGLVIGADDYVTKPFSPREVVMRVKALIRRTQQTINESKLSFNDDKLIIDLVKKEVKLDNEILTLTPNEYKLLTAIVSYPGKVYSRADLLEKLQENDSYFEGYERNIDTHIKNLRKKIETDTRHPNFIITVFGMGYKFGGIKDESDT